MPEFDKPTIVTEQGTRAIIGASPSGLVVRTRDATGADSSATIPADVAIVLLENAEQLKTALMGGPRGEVQTITADDVGAMPDEIKG